MTNTTTTAFLRVASIVIVGGVSCVACGDSKTLPQNMIGSFVQTAPTVMGLTRTTANLDVTSTGLATRSAGTPPTSVLFKSVSCSGGNGNACKFVSSDDRCDGSITRDDAGDVTIKASGICASSLAGKWFGPKSTANIVPSGPMFH